jgi:hypothetical protein
MFMEWSGQDVSLKLSYSNYNKMWRGADTMAPNMQILRLAGSHRQKEPACLIYSNLSGPPTPLAEDRSCSNLPVVLKIYDIDATRRVDS